LLDIDRALGFSSYGHAGTQLGFNDTRCSLKIFIAPSD
jgi:hypothetical protein